MSPFEILMLLCFGISWPIDIVKTLRVKTVEGKSPLFMIVILCGYIAGTLHKVFYHYDGVIVLYILNALFIGIDILLYFYFSRKQP